MRRATAALLLVLAGVALAPAPAGALTRKEVRLLHQTGVEALAARKYDEAQLYFKNILTGGFDLPEARSNLAFAYFKLGRLDDAIAELKQALQVDPEFPDALNNLACVFLAKTGFEREALAYAGRAVRLAPGNASYHDTLGLAYRANALPDRAKAEYRRAGELDRKSVTPLIHLGDLHLELGEKQEAVLAFRQVLGVEPDNLAANWNLYRLFAKEDKINAAKYRLERIFAAFAGKPDDPTLAGTVRDTIVCNFKAYLTELAVIISRVESRKESEQDFFINYQKIGRTVVAGLVPPDLLFCPSSGKFYTSFVNHVVCPIHESSAILTENIQDIRDIRKRFNGEICLRARYGLAFALARYRIGEAKKVPADLADLVTKGYLIDLPVCPNGGVFEFDDKGLIRCDVHGDFENLR